MVNFVDEEGARFGVSCAGSRMITGGLSPDRARALRDASGISMAEAMRLAGRQPEQLGPDPEALARVGSFIELHIEQGRGLIDLGQALAVGSGLWPHGRWRIDVPGEANHAGTTRLSDRRDAVIGCARAVLVARVRGRGARQSRDHRQDGHSARRRECHCAVRLLRGSMPARPVSRRCAHGGSDQGEVAKSGAVLTEESWTPQTAFDDALVAGWPAPRRCTRHGYRCGTRCRDTGECRRAGAMIFVRNPTGTSHSPAEWAEPEDCLAGVAALADRVGRSGWSRAVSSYWAPYAWLPDGCQAGVSFDVRRRAFHAGRERRATPSRSGDLAGRDLPGLANGHSHAFHRGLRGRTHGAGGTFWTWRQQMYALAARLEPDSYFSLARAVFAEMALAG